jgi:MoaA/NifB/PqqE/SkfB family radical SAM enzyme
VIELTDRCNLRCRHCFDARHAGMGDLPLGLVEDVVRAAPACGVDHVSFTGGEPTLHRDFDRIIELCAEAGLTFSLVSNGSTFPKKYRRFLARRSSFRGVTFSLDGAREETHDRIRGDGSYRQVMRAASICNFTGLPFTLNMVLTAENRGEVGELVGLAGALGSRGVRFGHLMPGRGVHNDALELSLDDRRAVDDRIRALQQTASLPVLMAPGHYSESPLFPCGPLELEEMNVDCRGNLTLCCHLSGYWGDERRPDVVASLHEVSLAEASAAFRQRVHTYLDDKRARVANGEFGESDHFPCLYCVRYLGGTPQPVTLRRGVTLVQVGQ